MTKRPDKFQGEPEYVSDFWERAQNGGASEIDGTVFRFTVTREDSERYSDLKPGMRLLLAETPDGSVFHKLLAPRMTN